MMKEQAADIGIDISKAYSDVVFLPTGEYKQYDNNT